MSDRFLRAITEDGLYRVAVARTDQTVAEATRRHRLSPVAAVALARALTATTLLATGDKDLRSVSAQWVGRGALRTVHAEFRPRGALRGYVGDPTAPGRSVSSAMGAGVLTVIRQDPEGRSSQGSIALGTRQIDEDLERYLRTSEQVPSRLRVSVDIGPDDLPTAVTGLLVQTLPGGAADAVLGGNGAVARAALRRELRASLEPEEYLRQALPGVELTLLHAEPLAFACPCSWERVRRGVALLPTEELLQMMADGESAEVDCQFCAEHYVLSPDDIELLLQERLGAEER